jgi:hypothetical protein
MNNDRRWLDLLEAEIARRRTAALEAAGGDLRKQLQAVLDQTRARMLATPGAGPPIVELDPAEVERDLAAWFKEHGCAH